VIGWVVGWYWCLVYRWKSKTPVSKIITSLMSKCLVFFWQYAFAVSKVSNSCITRKELNIIKDEICFCLKQGINQCKGSKAIIKALTNYVVEVEYKEAYLIFELSSQFTFIAKNLPLTKFYACLKVSF
jgi:hypothetical protein